MEKDNIIEREKGYFDRGMLSDAIVFFTFTLFAYSAFNNEIQRTVAFSSQELFVIPKWSYMLYGTFTLILAIVFLISTFNKKLANAMKGFIEKPAGFIYWAYFLSVYVVTWVNALELINHDEFVFYLVVYIGFIIFIIIFIMFIKAFIRFVRWLVHFKIIPHKNI
jgi:hypothetical protein